MNSRRFGFVALGLIAAVAPTGARADKIKHPTAVFAGLDKITGRIITFDVATDETVQFGSLQVTPRACYTRPPTEAPLTDGFIEVDEVETDNKFKRIFSGWMFAASPGLHGVEHAVYDVWLTDCKGGTQVITETAALPEETINPPAQPQPPKPGTTPRQRANRQPNADPNQPGGAPPAVAGVPPGASPLPTGAQLPGQPPRPPGTIDANRPRPPAPVAANPPPQRRAPSQSFFPTAANPGDSARERDQR